MADKNIQMTQRNASNTGWDNLYPITKASNVQVTPISGLSGTDVQTVLQNLFQFANDGKTAVANAITAKGVSASPSETFASLAAKIGQISTGKKWANGTAPATTTFSTYKKPDGTNTTARNFYSVEVNQNLGFIPSLIIVERFPYSYTIYDNRKINYEIQVYENIDYNKGTSVGAFNGYTIKNESPAYVSSSGFRLPVISDGKPYTFNWIAIE
jgi:hypothetical protein